MAASLVGKLLNLMGFEETPVEEVEDHAAEEIDMPLLPARSSGRGRAKVVGLPTAPGGGGKVVVTRPVDFDEAKEVADHLKNRRMVIVNLEGADAAAAQRIVDFASGAAFAADGTIERIGRQIFLFAPSNVDVSAAFSLDREDQDQFPWLG